MCERLTFYDNDGLSPAEVQEFAKAKAEGRLVVLPCKVGDVIYRVAGGEIQPCIVQYFYVNAGNEVETIYFFGNGLKAGATRHLWGKTIFLSREAAEKAKEVLGFGTKD
jgi:hypothetical protein